MLSKHKKNNKVQSPFVVETNLGNRIFNMRIRLLFLNKKCFDRKFVNPASEEERTVYRKKKKQNIPFQACTRKNQITAFRFRTLETQAHPPKIEISPYTNSTDFYSKIEYSRFKHPHRSFET